MIYLRKFENHSQYEIFTGTSEFILPNVSLCINENEVHYNPYIPTPPIIDGHEYVDLGLPTGTLWATMNVGASSETEYGNYYQYGKGAAQYAVTSGQSNYMGNENPLAASADTATQVWGGSWHMPTSAQCKELIDNTTYEWTTIDGINGCKFTAQNGNYVFFPADGWWYNSKQSEIGTKGRYWTSTPDTSRSKYAYSFRLSDELIDVAYYHVRDYGYAIRPVVG